jgi:type IV pilus assembly protein PilY1
MRRGGNFYYAMDVTDRANPRVLWKITGGAGDFVELGDTWSKPVLRKIRLGGDDRLVLIFGGGYDTNQDAVSERTPDGVGRAVYIVDAETGQRLWWAADDPGASLTLTDMDYSIPSDVAAIDSNGDGYANILYVGDMGGQLWRFDIERGETATDNNLATLMTGGRIADLAVDNSPADTRRFYYPPDVARVKFDGNYYLSIILSSGFRAHPLDTTVQDRIYMIRDLPLSGAPTTYTTLDEADLYDTTSNIIAEGNDTQQDQALNELRAAHGWYIDLEETGEKGLARPTIFNGVAFVTSYIPTDSSSGQTCAPSEGTGRIYLVNMLNGTPVYNTDPTIPPENLTKDDRFVGLVKAGIPGDPRLIKTADPNQKNWTTCVGTECFDFEIRKPDEILYWFEL